VQNDAVGDGRDWQREAAHEAAGAILQLQRAYGDVDCELERDWNCRQPMRSADIENYAQYLGIQIACDALEQIREDDSLEKHYDAIFDEIVDGVTLLFLRRYEHVQRVYRQRLAGKDKAYDCF
jgi:hypothetical protein